MAWKGWVAVFPSQDLELVACQVMLIGEGWESEEPCSFSFTTATPLKLWSHLPYSCSTSVKVPWRDDLLNSVLCPSNALSQCFAVGRACFLCPCPSFHTGVIPDFAVDYSVRMRERLNFNLYLVLGLLSFFWVSLSLFPSVPYSYFFALDLAYVNCPDCVNYLTGYFFQFMAIATWHFYC